MILLKILNESHEIMWEITIISPSLTLSHARVDVSRYSSVDLHNFQIRNSIPPGFRPADFRSNRSHLSK